MHANNRPIVKLPNRSRVEGIPTGWTDVTINGHVYAANFVREFINVIRPSQESEDNILGDILRNWFGPNAGQPGTRFQVEFRRVDGKWTMQPVREEEADTAD